MHFSAQMNLAFRAVEIIGQLLKNHYVKFDALPKKELYLRAAKVSLRGLNFLVDSISEDTEYLSDLVKQIDPKIDNEKDARKAVFHLAYSIIFAFIKTISQFTGTDDLSQTYDDVLKDYNDLIFKVIDISIKLDFYDDFPMKELRALAKDCKNNHLALATIRSLVQYRMYMRPIDSIQEKQQICDAIGITMQKTRVIEQKSVKS